MKKIILKGVFFLICYFGVNSSVSAGYVIERSAEYVMEVYGEGQVEVMPTIRVVDNATGRLVAPGIFRCDEMEGRIMFTFNQEGDYTMEISAPGYLPHFEDFVVGGEGEAVGELNVLRPVTLESANYFSILCVNLDFQRWNTMVGELQIERMFAKREEVELLVA